MRKRRGEQQQPLDHLIDTHEYHLLVLQAPTGTPKNALNSEQEEEDEEEEEQLLPWFSRRSFVVSVDRRFTQEEELGLSDLILRFSCFLTQNVRGTSITS
jgi:hypothetical protein